MATLNSYGAVELPPEGLSHRAVLTRLVDEGLQPGKFGSSRVRDLVGKQCTLSIEHAVMETGSVFANTEVKPAKGTAVYVPVTEKVFISLHPAEFDQAAIDRLPDRQREKIQSSETYRQVVGDLKFAKQEQAGGRDHR